MSVMTPEIQAMAWPRTTVEWIPPASPGGSPSSYNLTSGEDGIYIMPGMRGFDAPPVQLHYDELPALDGGYLRHTRHQTRELFLPLFLFAPDRGSLLRLKREFLASLNPSRGAGQIKVTEGDGSSRYITVHYASGAEGDEGKDQHGFTWLKYGLILRALDPYWYSGALQTVVFFTSENLKRFFDGSFLGEWRLNPDHGLNGRSRLTVTGEVDTWPVWTIHGPGSNIRLIRLEPDGPLTLALDVNLEPEDVVVIDTRPGHKSVINQTTGESLWPLLGPNPNLWPIAPGPNEIQITVDGAREGSFVSLSYRPRYLSA